MANYNFISSKAIDIVERIRARGIGMSVDGMANVLADKEALRSFDLSDSDQVSINEAWAYYSTYWNSDEENMLSVVEV